jgi:hypothetical protein
MNFNKTSVSVSDSVSSKQSGDLMSPVSERLAMPMTVSLKVIEVNQ